MIPSVSVHIETGLATIQAALCVYPNIAGRSDHVGWGWLDGTPLSLLSSMHPTLD
jgi:hypothetical protein